MTPLPEAFPSPIPSGTLRGPSSLRRQVFRRRGCSHDSAEIRSFPPISRSFLFFSLSPRALLYSPAGEIGPGLFSFRVYLVSRAPHTIVLLFSYPPPFLSPRATPVLPSLHACSSIPVSWDLARERLSSYIEKSSGREKNWRYLYHPLCRRSTALLRRRAESVSRGKTCVFN